MSSWASVTLDGMVILETQNYFHEWYFKKSERLIELVDASNYYDEDHVPAGTLVEQYIYKISAKTLRRRLDLAGYNRQSLEQDFKERHKQLMSDLEEMMELCPERVIDYIDTVRSSTVDDWLACLKEIKLTKERTEPNEVTCASNPTLMNFMLSTETFFSNYPSWGNYHFPCMSEEGYAVALLEITNESADCIQDITDLVLGGWTQAFDDLVEFNHGSTKFYGIFCLALEDIRTISALAPDNPILARLLYAAVITAMETYLSDTLKKQVINRDAIKRKFIRNHKAFQEKKFTISNIFEQLDNINESILMEIDKISFHNLNTIPDLYKSVLSTSFPKNELAELKPAVLNRHDIIHRNGKNVLDKTLNIDMADVEKLILLVDTCIKYIDTQIKDGLLDDMDNSEDI
jgi:hypothetical protein